MRKDNIGTSAKANSAVIKLREIIEGNCAKYSLTYKLQKNEGIITNNIIRFDLKPPFPDTPENWQDRVESVFSGYIRD